MNAEAALLAKAERYLRSAELLAQDGDYDSAASRIYYAMFYVAEALLAARNLSFSSHQGVISAFGQHFAKPGLLDARYHRALITAYSRRQLGDYATASGLTVGVINDMLREAREFAQAARTWLEAK